MKESQEAMKKKEEWIGGEETRTSWIASNGLPSTKKPPNTAPDYNELKTQV